MSILLKLHSMHYINFKSSVWLVEKNFVFYKESLTFRFVNLCLRLLEELDMCVWVHMLYIYIIIM